MEFKIGMFPKVQIESYVDRSAAHKNAFWRSSIDAGKKFNKAINIGNCIKAGMQPEKGLAPAFLYNAIFSWFFFMASAGSAYFLFITSISGFSKRILVDEMYVLYAIGNNSVLRMIVSIKIM